MRVELLSDNHPVTLFESGVKSLDDWLCHHGLENQKRNLSRVFVLLSDSNEVLGYYSLTMGGVRKSNLPNSYARGLPAIDIGMVLLGRFAVKRTHQGQGIGRDLLVDAIIRAAHAGEQAAARFICVDPIDNGVRAYYKHFGFKDIEGDEYGRMYLSIAEAQAALLQSHLSGLSPKKPDSLS